MTDEVIKPSRFPLKKRLLVAAAVLLVLVAAVLATLALTAAHPDNHLERIRAAGLPVQLADLNTYYSAVPAASNAAIGVLEATDLYVTAPGALNNVRMPQPGEELPPELKEAIALHLRNNSQTLERLNHALQLPGSRYPISFTNVLYAIPDHLSPVKGLAVLLNHHTIYHASEGNSDAAFRSAQNGFILAATLRNEPLLISELVRIACVAIAVNSLEHLLSRSTLTDPQLTALSSLLASAEADSSHAGARALAGERAFGIQNFQTTASNLVAPAARWEVIQAPIHRWLGFRDRDFRIYLEMMTGISDAMTNRFPAAFQQAEEVEQQINRRFSTGFGRFAILTRMVAPAVIKFPTKEAAIVTRLRFGQLAIAIERYRLAHNNSLPASTTALVPTFLPEIPTDPIAGEPLLFQPTNPGYKLSSPIAAQKLNNQRTAQFNVAR